MNAWLVLAIAIAAVVVVVWLIAELERWASRRRRARRGVGELRDFSELGHPRDRRPW